MPYIWRCQISYNGSGTFAINSTGQPVVAGTVISSTVFNSLTADLGTGLSTAITKDGQTTTTARILFAAGISSTLATDATSISTGSILTLGGLGVTKAAWIGGLMNVAGAATFQSTIGITGALNATTINASGLVAMAAAATVGTTLAVTGTTTAAAINASGTVAMAGAATVGTTLGVTGASTLTGNVSFRTMTSTNLIAHPLITLDTSGTGQNLTLDVNDSGSLARVGPNSNTQLDIITANTARITIAGTGAVTIPGTLGVTGVTTVGVASILSTVDIFQASSASGTKFTGAFNNTHATTPNGITVNYSAADPNGTANEFLYCNGVATLRASIRSNGGIANFSANNVNLSDKREKTNFAPAKSYLDVICAIPVQTFNYIDQNMEDDPGLTLGVIAQDVEAVAPEMVMESNWGTMDDPKMRLSIYQTDLQYALMKALQELAADFQSYKSSHP